MEGTFTATVAPVPVPEPATLLLLGSGMAVLARRRLRPFELTKRQMVTPFSLLRVVLRCSIAARWSAARSVARFGGSHKGTN